MRHSIYPGPLLQLYEATVLQTCCKFHKSSALRVQPKNVKGKTVSSQKWLTRHLNDPYVAKARKLGYRARSAFKLIELDDKFKLLKPGMRIVDCGAAPGAWSQVAAKRVCADTNNLTTAFNQPGVIVAVDLLDIEPVPGVIVLPKSDFTSAETQARILSQFRSLEEANTTESSDAMSLSEKPTRQLLDGILSDMAPNASGDSGTDHYRIISLVNSVISFAVEYCKPGSFLIAKFWNGQDNQKMLSRLNELYKVVKVTRPGATRSESAESFVIAKDKR